MYAVICAGNDTRVNKDIILNPLPYSLMCQGFSLVVSCFVLHFLSLSLSCLSLWLPWLSSCTLSLLHILVCIQLPSFFILSSTMLSKLVRSSLCLPWSLHFAFFAKNLAIMMMSLKQLIKTQKKFNVLSCFYLNLWLVFRKNLRFNYVEKYVLNIFISPVELWQSRSLTSR